MTFYDSINISSDYPKEHLDIRKYVLDNLMGIIYRFINNEISADTCYSKILIYLMFVRKELLKQVPQRHPKYQQRLPVRHGVEDFGLLMCLHGYDHKVKNVKSMVYVYIMELRLMDAIHVNNGLLDFGHAMHMVKLFPKIDLDHSFSIPQDIVYFKMFPKCHSQFKRRVDESNRTHPKDFSRFCLRVVHTHSSLLIMT